MRTAGPDTALRLRFVTALFGLCFVILVGALFYKQIVHGRRYYELSEHNRLRLISESATRGLIVARDGQPLVGNRLVFDVVALPRELPAAAETTVFAMVAQATAVDAALLQETYYQNIDYGLNSVLLLEDISRDTAFALEEQREYLPGIFVKPRAARDYPLGEAVAHVVGYVGALRPAEYNELSAQGYTRDDRIGRTGLERHCERIVRGKNGGMQLEVDSKGAVMRVLQYKPPVAGSDVRTSIDLPLQQHIARVFPGAQAGAVVVMDAENGELLALYSAPSFDPGMFVRPGNSAALRALFSDAATPLLNRSVTAYAPGSIFKIVPAYAGLAEKKVTERTRLLCEGAYSLGTYTKYCWHRAGHGDVDARRALAVSCNVYFYRLALLFKEEEMSAYARLFGLGALTGIELPEERAGIVPDSAWKRQRLNKSWFSGDSLNFAIGQGYLLCSPVQAAKMTAVIANGGMSVTPHLIPADFRRPVKRVVGRDLTAVIAAGMRDAVALEQGTARKAAVSGLAVHGKTGTAQTGSRTAPHAWFAGFAPIGQRIMCVIVFVEHGGQGGDMPAMVAREVFSFMAAAG